MNASGLAEIKRQINFESEDDIRIRELAEAIRSLIPDITERVCLRLGFDSEAWASLTQRNAGVDQQRELFAEWLEDVFSGEPDDGYLAQRHKMGLRLARTGTEQQDLVSAFQLISEQVSAAAENLGVPAVRAGLRSFSKRLAIELAAVLDGYRDGHAERIRRSERRAVEEELTRAEHLAEIGQLAASLAHEIKNPLAGISGAIQIIREAMPPEDPHRQIITEILGQIKRLDATVKDLLQYARPAPPRLTEFPLGQVLARVLKVLREEPALQSVHVEGGLVPAGIAVYGDDSQIEQLIINLILNAAQASEAGGGIRLAVKQDNDRVSLIVQDSGKGMSAEVLEQAFEPFYTTKARGTGLGLSICRRIVEAHGGTIQLESEVDRGTTVTVDLPRWAPGHRKRKAK